MHTKEIDATATVAWAPASNKRTCLATGTLAGAMDASFSTSAELGLWEVNLADREGSSTKKLGSIASTSRFNRLAWSAQEGHGEDGVLVGGLEDGTVAFWSASRVLGGGGASSEADCLIAKKEGAHRGAVKGLQVNPFQANLIASGSLDAHIALWDLGNLGESFAPAQNKSSRLEDITDLAWNCQVAHILASASNNGYTVVWDLRNRKEVVQLALPGGRRSVSAVAWNPDQATHLLTATDDDLQPAIYSWDLRNAHAPTQTLTGGHTKGVLSLAWCPKDSELLLSSGKDSRVLCWNPQAGSFISEVTSASNWIFDTKWSPRNPDIFVSASFDGQIRVSSFQALSSGTAAAPAPFPAGRSSNPADFFAHGQQAQTQPPAGDKASRSVVQIPRWYKRPMGAVFGFGGRLVSFSEFSGRRVTVSGLAPSAVPAFAQASLQLDAALRQNALGDFVERKAPSGGLQNSLKGATKADSEGAFWAVVKVLLGQDPQKHLLGLLGFDRSKVESQIRTLTGSKEDSVKVIPEENEEVSPLSPSSPIDFGQEASSSVFDQLNQLNLSAPDSGAPLGRRQSIPFRLLGPDTDSTDRLITQAIIVGDFGLAVEACLKAERLSDALLVSLCGSPELLAQTQETLLQRTRNPYLRVVGALAKRDLTDVVQSGDLGNWEEILSLICSFATSPADFGRLCGILADRLATADANTSPQAGIICAMAAGRGPVATELVLRQEEARLRRESKALGYTGYAAWLEALVEKVRSVEQASARFATDGAASTAAASSSLLGHQYLAYAVLMADQGCLAIAARYLASLSLDFLKTSSEGGADEDPVALFVDRLCGAVNGLPGAPAVASGRLLFAQPLVNVVPEKKANAAAQTASSPGMFSQQPAPPHQQQPQQHLQQQQAWAPPQPGQWAPPPAPTGPPQHPSSVAAPVPGAWNPPPALVPAAPPAPTTAAAAFGFGGPSHPPAPVAPTPYSAGPSMPSTPSFAVNPFAAAPQAPVQGQPQTSFMAGPPAAPMAPVSMAPSMPAPYGAPPVAPAAPFNPYGGQQQQSSPTDMAPHHPPTIPQPGISFVGAVPSAISPPPIVSPSGGAPVPSLPPKPVGGFNDAPVIAPRAPQAAAVAPITQPILHPVAPLSPTMAPPSMAPSTAAPPQSAMAAAVPPPTSPRHSLGPVDPALIPATSQPIFQTLNSLITFCQQRVMPVQRRVLEDSVKRLQHLFHQLAASELSPGVHQSVSQMCSLIAQRNFDGALEMHVPLMTAHFTEVGQWILAVKRLIEVAKTCPQ